MGCTPAADTPALSGARASPSAALAAACVHLALALLLGRTPSEDAWPAVATYGLLLATKTCPVLLLACWTHQAPGAYATRITCGLFFGALGDAILVSSTTDAFIMGLLSFLVCHAFYLAAFVADCSELFLPVFAPVLVALLVFSGKLLPHCGALTMPVLLYSVVISLMCWRACARYAAKLEIGHAPHGYALAAFGSLSFALSDSLIAWNRFVTPIPHEKLWIMSSYWLGQFGIAYSVWQRVA